MPTFTDLLRNHYARTPDKAAVHILHSGKPDFPLTYRQLMQGAAGYARTYAAQEIQPGEVIVLILQHGVDLLYAYFGAVLHGAIPAIMPFLTEKLLPERYRADLASLVSVTRPAAIVTYPDFAPEVSAALRPGDPVRSVVRSDRVDPPCEPDFSALGGLARRPGDIALLQHSSGTTGLQKGVALSHQAVFNQLESYRLALRLRADDVFVSWLPLYHDMGLIACYLMPILLGCPLVLMSPFDWVRAPYRLLQAVSRYRGTLSWLPNFAYNFCAQKIRDRDLEGVDLSSWRAISNCSEPMRWESHQAFYERFRDFGLRYESLATCYAMAENVFAVTQGGIEGPVVVDEVDRDSLQMDRIARPPITGKATIRMLSAGRPIRNAAVRVVDGHGRDVPERTIGELALKSDCMLSEYFHRPDATKKAFLDGWYLTGDFGYLADGEVYVTGRKKDLIIVGGKNIYPQDLEQLAMGVPGVHPGRVAAFGVFNETSGTEDVVMVAEVDEEAEEDRQRVADQIRAAVTRGSAVALRYVHIVGQHWLVKTSSGKTARSANREKFLKEMAEAGTAF
jgi:acyl-CoA synthetase (AMP-forming)/AMP-acid ligase II